MNTPTTSLMGGPERRQGAVAGALLVACSVLVVLLLHHHPTAGTRDPAAALERMARAATASKIVHGGVIALMGGQAVALLELSSRLDVRRAIVRGALVAYGAGLLGFVGATLLSGYIIPTLAIRYEAGTGPRLDMVTALVSLCTLGNRTLATFGTAAFSGAIFLWSWALRDRSRAVALLGVVVAIVPPVALVVGALDLEVPGMMAIALGQSVWNVAVGVALLSGRV